mmetsp:Transcript_24524/g.61737  ORF Transcript_24524/g.61737 Transcript_24524/m.61737 type:complete len:231 (-) Transcript_24524:1652-2344(-)
MPSSKTKQCSNYIGSSGVQLAFRTRHHFCSCWNFAGLLSSRGRMIYLALCGSPSWSAPNHPARLTKPKTKCSFLLRCSQTVPPPAGARLAASDATSRQTCRSPRGRPASPLPPCCALAPEPCTGNARSPSSSGPQSRRSRAFGRAPRKRKSTPAGMASRSSRAASAGVVALIPGRCRPAFATWPPPALREAAPRASGSAVPSAEGRTQLCTARSLGRKLGRAAPGESTER